MIKEFISHKVYLVKGGTKTEEFHIFSLAHILTNYIRNTLKKIIIISEQNLTVALYSLS